MCFAHTQMVMLLLPPTAQMDCQSSHWKPFQERSYPKSIGKELSAPIHQKYCRNKTAIYIAWQMRHSNKAETLKSPFCLTQIKSCLPLCSLRGAAGHHKVSTQPPLSVLSQPRDRTRSSYVLPSRPFPIFIALPWTLSNSFMSTYMMVFKAAHSAQGPHQCRARWSLPWLAGSSKPDADVVYYPSMSAVLGQKEGKSIYL